MDPRPRFWSNQFVPLGLLLGVAIIIVGIIASWTAITVKNANDTLTVTGSATENVAADSAKWTVTAQRSALETAIPTATAEVLADTKKIETFFENAGISASEITVGAVHTNVDYTKYNPGTNEPTRYVVTQNVTVTSKDPQLIQQLAQNTTALTDQGILLLTQDPQYLISQLPQYRISLAAAAMQDARARATQLVKDSGQKVGALRGASTGAVQVMAANSIEVSDYGSYDTSTIDKTVMVTVRATFAVR